jgi:hypothetical protein
MSERVLVAIPCKLSRGFFSSERLFEVVLANGEVYTSITPRHFCWNATGKPLREAEGMEKDIAGLVAARVVEPLDGGQTAVEVPDGKVLAVNERDIRPRPTPITPPGNNQHP